MPKGNWIITHSGKKVYPLDFRPEMFDIEDVAHALSMICRFTGHCPKFYSVAEHSCLVSDEVWRLTQDPAQALQALLHDCAEAYLNDLSQPLKASEEFAFYKSVELAIEQVIFEIHKLPTRILPLVKQVDMGMLLKEGYLFFPHSITEWTYPPKDTPIPDGLIQYNSPKAAWMRFRVRYMDLFSQLPALKDGI